MVIKDCNICGGDGYYEEYNKHGDLIITDPCPECYGDGTWFECPECYTIRHRVGKRS